MNDIYMYQGGGGRSQCSNRQRQRGRGSTCKRSMVEGERYMYMYGVGVGGRKRRRGRVGERRKEGCTNHLLFLVIFQCVKSVLLNKIVSSEKDLVGVVLFGTVSGHGLVWNSKWAWSCSEQ